MRQNRSFGLLVLFAALWYAVMASNWNQESRSQADPVVGPDNSESPIHAIRTIDLEQDGQPEEAQLVYNRENGDVVLQVGTAREKILDVESEAQIFDPKPSDQYVFQLFAAGNIILVGSTYSFTNKYGSTSTLTCLEYKDDQLTKTWSPNDFVISFAFMDFNEDGTKELITKTVVQLEEFPGIQIRYTAYQFSNQGVKPLDSWPSGTHPELERNV